MIHSFKFEQSFLQVPSKNQLHTIEESEIADGEQSRARALRWNAVAGLQRWSSTSRGLEFELIVFSLGAFQDDQDDDNCPRETKVTSNSR